MFVFKRITEISKEDFTAFMGKAAETYVEYCELSEEYIEYFNDPEYCNDILYDFYVENFPTYEANNAHGRFFVTMVDDLGHNEKIIGQVTHTKDQFDRDRVTYYLLPEFRRQGLMGAAYDKFINNIQDSPYTLKTLFAAVNSDNTPSMHFLLSRGFNYVGFQEDSGYEKDDKKPRHVFTKDL
ncbi:MAG: hypothetical protein CL565_06075 [Alphaproteobacteria bacterium]|nr:hypothetical protein [Alphaproteobacteria bacterium]|tara:strand:- start:79 stop:624 length:546 start_codon:yes stop_codon:yes gene_type:complete